MEENKKFSEMSLVDFVTDILKIELEEWQKQMLKMYEENRFNKNIYPTWVYPYNPNYPTYVWTNKDSGAAKPYEIYCGDTTCGGGCTTGGVSTTTVSVK